MSIVRIKPWQLAQRQSLPLAQKIILSQQRIKAWHKHFDGDVCVSFSGGLDSSVLLHIARGIYPDMAAVFSNTGLEFPEIVAHVKATENVTVIRPDKTFRQVIEQYGYPVISKRTAQYVHEVQGAKTESATKRLRLTGYTSDGRYSKMSKIPNKWQYLCKAPFKISDRCCHWLKKRPLRHLTKTLKLTPMLGTRADESQQRTQTYYIHGCNSYHLKSPRSTPLAFWKNRDIRQYIQEFDVAYSRIYDMGYRRTGCMFCLFGVHLESEPNRFQRMEISHPEIWNYCMDVLGIQKVLDYIRVPSQMTQILLPTFTMSDL